MKDELIVDGNDIELVSQAGMNIYMLKICIFSIQPLIVFFVFSRSHPAVDDCQE